MTPVTSLQRDIGFQAMVRLLWQRGDMDTCEIAAFIRRRKVFGFVSEADVYGAMARLRGMELLPEGGSEAGARRACKPSLGVSSRTVPGANAGGLFGVADHNATPIQPR